MGMSPLFLSKEKSGEEIYRHIQEGRRRGLELYFRLIGLRETNTKAVHPPRLKPYGPSCGWCGKPLRTPKAKPCAACWTPLAFLGRAE